MVVPAGKVPSSASTRTLTSDLAGRAPAASATVPLSPTEAGLAVSRVMESSKVRAGMASAGRSAGWSVSFLRSASLSVSSPGSSSRSFFFSFSLSASFSSEVVSFPPVVLSSGVSASFLSDPEFSSPSCTVPVSCVFLKSAELFIVRFSRIRPMPSVSFSRAKVISAVFILSVSVSAKSICPVEKSTVRKPLTAFPSRIRSSEASTFSESSGEPEAAVSIFIFVSAYTFPFFSTV